MILTVAGSSRSAVPQKLGCWTQAVAEVGTFHFLRLDSEIFS